MKVKEYDSEIQYKCEICGNIYKKGRSDKEAKEECENIWGKVENWGNYGLVCDDCWKEIMGIN